MRITKLHLLLILSAIIAGGGYVYYRVRQQEKNALQEIYQAQAGGEAATPNQAEDQPKTGEPAVVEEQVEMAEEQARVEEEQRVRVQAELARVKGLIEKGKSENFDVVSAEEMFNLGVKSFENKNYPPALQCFLEAAERLKKAVPSAPKEVPAKKLETPGSPTSPTSYKVKRGDSLWSIAKRKSIYGRGGKWIKIWKANENQIKDFDLIYAGQTLLIPDNRNKNTKKIDSKKNKKKVNKRSKKNVQPSVATN
ncbi:MAG: LysM peptidoglycan-binding domain-containing protein [Elusimicrobiota bacterium]